MFVQFVPSKPESTAGHYCLQAENPQPIEAHPEGNFVRTPEGLVPVRNFSSKVLPESLALRGWKGQVAEGQFTGFVLKPAYQGLVYLAFIWEGERKPCQA